MKILTRHLILPDSRSYTNLTINLSAYDPDGDRFEYALEPNDLDIIVHENFNETPYYNAELDVADGVYEFIVCERYRVKISLLLDQQSFRLNQLHCVADDEYKELGLVMYA